MRVSLRCTHGQIRCYVKLRERIFENRSMSNNNEKYIENQCLELLLDGSFIFLNLNTLPKKKN